MFCKGEADSSESQSYLLRRIDFNNIPELINQLYEVGALRFRFTPNISKLDKSTMREDGLKNLVALVTYIIMKNEKVLQGRRPKTVIGSAIYLSCKKLGIQVTYRDLYRLGVTEYSLRMTVKRLRF